MELNSYSADDFKSLLNMIRDRSNKECVRLTGAYIVWSSTLENTIRIYCN